MAEGRIIKALSGFYYVQTDDAMYECRGRGVFRKKKITPLVGDFVTFEITDDRKGYILEIKPRANQLDRPPISNINQAAIVCSATQPNFSPSLLDKFLVMVEAKHIKPIIFITKMDKVIDDELIEIKRYQQDYEQIGYPVELVISKEDSNLTHLGHYFKEKVTVIAGQSGVGKSSLLNAINPSLLIKTDEISTSLGRGKHTTRHVELLEINNGLVADTPGFSSLDFNEIEVEELGDCFPEMLKRKEMCKFRGCLHHREPGCAVKEAVENEEIKQYRYENYITFLNDIQSRKPRY